MKVCFVKQFVKGRFLCMLLSVLLLCAGMGASNAQTFTYNTSAASEILSGDAIHAHLLPDTMTVWCNNWYAITSNPTTWGNTLKFKSNNTFVEFFVDDFDSLIEYATLTHYTYRLIYTIYGYNNPSDTLHGYVTMSDTLTISYNNTPDNTPYQDHHLKKYSGFYKAVIVLDNIYLDAGSGTLTAATLATPSLRKFKVEGSIVTQNYDKNNYGSGGATVYPTIITSAHPTDNYVGLSWYFSGIAALTPVSYELEWTFIDDYATCYGMAGVCPLSSSALTYNFQNNCTRISTNSASYNIPLTYPSGYLVYRIRAVRPDSILFKYPI
jgi:hypothetical protein